jgi:hypothetical protein
VQNINIWWFIADLRLMMVLYVQAREARFGNFWQSRVRRFKLCTLNNSKFLTCYGMKRVYISRINDRYVPVVI